MCGRFTLAANKEVLEKHFGLKLKGRWEPRFNLAPEQVLPVVWNPGNPEFVRQSWGLRPAWWSHGARSLINIRVETLKAKATFKRLIAQQRCLVPANGFYEWQKSGRLSQPFRFTLKGRPFQFPGVVGKGTRSRRRKTFGIRAHHGSAQSAGGQSPRPHAVHPEA